MQVLETLCRHIADNCERLQHVEFGLLVRAENMQPVWSEHAPELKEGFKLYCSEEDNSAMSLHDFLRFLKETKIAGARLGGLRLLPISLGRYRATRQLHTALGALQAASGMEAV